MTQPEQPSINQNISGENVNASIYGDVNVNQYQTIAAFQDALLDMIDHMPAPEAKREEAKTGIIRYLMNKSADAFTGVIASEAFQTVANVFK